MELGLKNKRVLVTGASAGIGAAAARAFAREGAQLVLVARSADKLQAFARSLQQEHGTEVTAVPTDLSQGSNVRALAEAVGAVDVLVNNAGAVPNGSLQDVDEERWRAGWDSKVFAYVNMCRAFYPLIKRRGGGAIVNVLGNGSRVKKPAYICGGMANAALDFFTETLGAQSADDNIRVVGISPGPVDTDRYRSIAAARLASGTPAPHYPFGRVASPAEVARLIVLAASDCFSYVSGTVLVADGGMSVGTRT